MHEARVEELSTTSSVGAQVPAPHKGVVPPPVISRLLSGLSEAQASLLATFAVDHGVLCQTDGSDASQRVVLPLQLEVLQALLLQRLQHQREAPSLVRFGRVSSCACS